MRGLASRGTGLARSWRGRDPSLRARRVLARILRVIAVRILALRIIALGILALHLRLLARRMGFLARRIGVSIFLVCGLGTGILDRRGRAGNGEARYVGELELHVEIGHRLELGERRQLLETLQTEVIEEFACRPEQLRTPGHVALPDDADPVALEERLYDVWIDRDAAHGLDLPARDRLPIRDQRQCLEERPGITRGALGPQARDLLGELAPHLHAKSRGRLLDLDPPAAVIGLERRERRLDVGLARTPGLLEQRGEVLDREGPSGREECSLDDILQILLAHSSALPSAVPSAATTRSPRAGAAARTCSAANGSGCTMSIRPSRTSSRIATNVTVTPIRPSSGRNSRTNSMKLACSSAERMSVMRARTESRSRATR